MGIWLAQTDDTFNYPDTVVLLLSKDEEKSLQSELARTLDHIVKFGTVGCDMTVVSNAIVSAEDITSEARTLRNNIVNGRLCARCRSLLLPSPVEGYKYFCPHHYEDLMGFETVSGVYTPIAFQRFLIDFYDTDDLKKTLDALKTKNQQ